MAGKKPTKPAYDNRQLTKHLRELAAEIHDVDAETGETVTKGEALAKMVFTKALGGIAKKVDDEGNVIEVEVKPESWAIQLVWDRMEGKTPQAVPDNHAKIKAKDKVGELAKNRINAMTAGDDLKSQGPPSMS